MAPFGSGGVRLVDAVPCQLDPVTGARRAAGESGTALAGARWAATAAACAFAASSVATPRNGRYPCAFRYWRASNVGGWADAPDGGIATATVVATEHARASTMRSLTVPPSMKPVRGWSMDGVGQCRTVSDAANPLRY